MDHELIIRITFKSGAVSEERGTEAQVEALFNQDEDQRLIDHVMTADFTGNELALWHHEGDLRWENVVY